MKKKNMIKIWAGVPALVLVFAVVMLLWNTAYTRDNKFPDPPAEALGEAGNTQTAVLAGGCFWGMEAVFEQLKGVTDVISGYSGGEAKTAHYKVVTKGNTGHAESIEVTFDPSTISYGKLLKVYFSIAHDPTQLNYQGPDVGTHYRSVIFYADEHQKKIAEEYIRTLDQAKVYKKQIVTELVPLEKFYPAEAYHQDFMERNPDHPYIVYWDVPKVEHLKKDYPELMVQP
ncbi:MAG: peptide-methionine (S)-S-oxide reductase MsrA [Spirochaetota bacterium]|nr:MAG: peptide-methionine (S)-S-oxide reductase MsrA [Spirochaetota bacterium]